MGRGLGMRRDGGDIFTALSAPAPFWRGMIMLGKLALALASGFTRPGPATFVPNHPVVLGPRFEETVP
eukprot:3239719-Pyramimonas_sp.AAC.1